MHKMKNNWSLDEYREYIRTGKEPNHSVSSKATNNESITGNDMERADGIERFNRPVSVIIESRRHRLTDPWGCVEKYIIDSIVDRKILQDDSCKEICEEKSYHFQTKIPRSEEEKTIVKIKEVK